MWFGGRFKNLKLEGSHPIVRGPLAGQIIVWGVVVENDGLAS